MKITPMLRQFLELKNLHKDKLLLFRMGDFYETFLEDAKIASKILGITLTSRNRNAENPIPLAGFPYHALDSYLEKLVKAGLKVAICEQVEDPKLAKGLVKREIVDIITPGSILESKLIDNKQNNFLLAIYHKEKSSKYGFSYLDISTGDFYFTELNKDDLFNEIKRINPAEIVTDNEYVIEMLKEMQIEDSTSITLFDSWVFDINEAKQVLKQHFSIDSLEGIGGKSKPFGATAAGLALAYVKDLKNTELRHINSLRYYNIGNYMQLDETSIRNLELFKSIRYATKFGSLISIIDQTKTPMGSRLLNVWLSHPLLNKNDILRRQSLVEVFFNKNFLTIDLRNVLNEVGDLSRIMSKVGSKRINPREMLTLASYLSTAPKIKKNLSEFESDLLKSYDDKIENYNELVDYVEKRIVENPSNIITDGNIIADGCNDELDDLKRITKEGKSWIAQLESDEKERTGIPTLKVKFNKVFGYFIEVTKLHSDKIPDNYIRKQTLVNAERFISPELKKFESKVLGAEERIKHLEYNIFLEMRDYLFERIEWMQKYINVISELDVLSNLAFVAYNNSYVKPEFNDDGILDIIDCRHPVIERIIKDEVYIPNNINLNHTDNRIGLITGPNMAGKSTYLRQVGLNIILAQIGAFVAASKATLPIFDKVFTRVGASDNLAMGQSTFLVEMLETANILNSATPDSLILLDEIGRGTSTFDGLSLAWAIVEYIHNNKKICSKTLFATHYHELTELENLLDGLKNYNILVKEINDEMIFLRKVERGGADQSYGIQVARLAGIPRTVISRAKRILKNLETSELSPQGLSNKIKKENNKYSFQLDIFDSVFEQNDNYQNVVDQIKDVDINKMTPLDALNLISRLKKEIKEK
jgi:DNA mismatch repair protein MutS